MPKNQVKLLLNLLLTATNAIPRGGSISARVTMDGDRPHFTIEARGPNSRIPVHASALIRGEAENGVVDAHGIRASIPALSPARPAWRSASRRKKRPSAFAPCRP